MPQMRNSSRVLTPNNDQYGDRKERLRWDDL